jgi:hypothetical protein
VLVALLIVLAACTRPIAPTGPAPGVREVQVDWGDTLWGIASRYDVAGGYPALARLNGIRNPDHIELGQRLRVPTADSSLPAWPVALPVPTALQPCRVEALPPARAVRVEGGESAMVDTGLGVHVAATRSREGGQLVGVSMGRMAWARAPWLVAADWSDAPGGEAEADPQNLVGFRVQLDADAEPEAVVGWALEANALGMSRWLVAVVDGSARERATVFEVANFGAGSFVARAGGDCSVLASEWALAHEPGESGEGWNLVARRLDLVDGELVPAAESGLLSRRLYHSFHPERTGAGRLPTGNVARDLASPSTVRRSLEPLAAFRRAGERSARVDAVDLTVHGLTVAAGWDAPLVVGADQAELPRVGHAPSGLLFPPAWTPAWPERLRGRPATLTSYLRSVYAEPVSLLWLGG